MLGAFGSSTLFLISYVITTPMPAQAVRREGAITWSISPCSSHVILAAAILPMAIVTFTGPRAVCRAQAHCEVDVSDVDVRVGDGRDRHLMLYQL
jgi:uncharacterized membrane protein YozB (DUF420 family)